MNFGILGSAALYFLTGCQTLVNPLVLFLLPFLWQAAAAAAPGPWLEFLDTAVLGHRVAENNLSFAAGIGIIQHVLCVAALQRNPRLLASIARALRAPAMRVRPAVFLFVNFLGLWTGMLSIVAAQEGLQTALQTLTFGLLVGPAAATALYLAAREAQIERRAARAAGVAYELDDGLFGTGVVSEV